MVKFSAGTENFLCALILTFLSGPSFGTTTRLSTCVKSLRSGPAFVYNWNISESIIKGSNFTVYNVFLTSTSYMTVGESDLPVWTHWMQVCIPDNLNPDNDLAFLYIDGGKQKSFDNPPDSMNPIITSVSVQTGSIGVDLGQIPNQPIRFTGDWTNRSRSEDAEIAYTWSHFINDTLGEEWLSRCPMTRASLKAMDAVEEVVNSLGLPPVNRFVVGGASKRGWTTWMVGAMGDPRVVGIVPIVAPIANLIPQMDEMWESYGEWSFALKDYEQMDIMGFFHLPVFQELLRELDPLTYQEEMARVPKLVIMAAGDEFFMPDSPRYFWDDLPGEKMLYIAPNAEHSLAGHITQAIGGAIQFFKTFQNETVGRPEYEWRIQNEGQTITLTVGQEYVKYISQASVWVSTDNKARDWRLLTCASGPKCVNPAIFKQQSLSPISPGVFEYTLDAPAIGLWSAFLIEVEFQLFPGIPLRVTSNLSIVPLWRPYEYCAADICGCGYHCSCYQGCKAVPNTPPTMIAME